MKKVKKFFESKKNRMIAAIAAMIIVLLAVIIVTVSVTRKKKAYEPETTVPPVETLTQAPTVTESEADTTTAESTTPEETEKGTSAEKDKDKTPKKSDNDKSDTDKSGGSGSKNNTPVINLGSILLEGRWSTAEYIAPSELFNSEFLAKTGFNQTLGVSTAYQFNSNKTFLITYEIHSKNDYVRAMREAYTVYFKEIYPEWTPEELEKRSDQTAWQEFWQICEAVIGVSSDSAGISGTYSNDENRIYYQCDGASFSETYVIKDKTLTLTGSSAGNEGYPIVLTRW